MVATVASILLGMVGLGGDVMSHSPVLSRSNFSAVLVHTSPHPLLWGMGQHARGGCDMTILNLSAAARACGIDRKTLYRAIKKGRISTTTNATGERGIDVAELLRVFGPLKETPQVSRGEFVDVPHSAPPPTVPDTALIEMLREQVRQAQEREARLLTMLETAQQVLQAEQQARRDLETKLLPAPRPAPVGKVRVWILLAVLAAALAFAGWHFRAVIVSALTP